MVIFQIFEKKVNFFFEYVVFGEKGLMVGQAATLQASGHLRRPSGRDDARGGWKTMEERRWTRDELENIEWRISGYRAISAKT